MKEIQTSWASSTWHPYLLSIQFLVWQKAVASITPERTLYDLVCKWYILPIWRYATYHLLPESKILKKSIDIALFVRNVPKTPGCVSEIGSNTFFWGGRSPPEVLDQWNPKIWNQGMKICWTSTWSVEPKIMGFYPPNHPFVHRAFPWFINHPFLGVKSPYFWKHPYKDNQNLTSNFWESSFFWAKCYKS